MCLTTTMHSSTRLPSSSPSPFTSLASCPPMGLLRFPHPSAAARTTSRRPQRGASVHQGPAQRLPIFRLQGHGAVAMVLTAPEPAQLQRDPPHPCEVASALESPELYQLPMDSQPDPRPQEAAPAPSSTAPSHHRLLDNSQPGPAQREDVPTPTSSVRSQLLGGSWHGLREPKGVPTRTVPAQLPDSHPGPPLLEATPAPSSATPSSPSQRPRQPDRDHPVRADVLLRFPCGNTLRAHSPILRIASPVFAVCLDSSSGAPAGGTAEARPGSGATTPAVAIKEATAGERHYAILDVDADFTSFQHLLRRLYLVAPRGEMTAHEAALLLPPCHKFKFRVLKQACRQALEGPEVARLLAKHSPVDSPRMWVTAFQWLELARDYALPGLEAQCLKYIYAWSSAGIPVLLSDEELLNAVDGLELKALQTLRSVIDVRFSMAKVLQAESAAAAALDAAAIEVKRLVAQRATERVPCLPRLALGEAELRQLRGLSKDTLVAIIQAAVDKGQAGCPLDQQEASKPPAGGSSGRDLGFKGGNFILSSWTHGGMHSSR